MSNVHGSVALLLVCIATTVDAQVKCNPVSFTVTGGWCKDKAVSYKGCFDAAAPDADKTSKAAFISANQALFAPYSQATCLTGAAALCGVVGGKPKDWDCKDVNNECSGDNLSNNVGVGACNTDAQCTAFAKSTMNICCDVIKKYMTDLICDNADKTKIDAVFVDGNYLFVHILQYRCESNSTCMCPHLILLSLPRTKTVVSPTEGPRRALRFSTQSALDDVFGASHTENASTSRYGLPVYSP